MKTQIQNQSGFTLIEMIVALTISSIALTGVYRIWKFQHTQSTRIEHAIEARNQLALTSAKLGRSVTLAGLGLSGFSSIIKSDEIGTDTLTLYSNPNEAMSTLDDDYDHSSNSVRVIDSDIFGHSTFLGISDSLHSEVRRITSVSSGRVRIQSNFTYGYSKANAKVYPVTREIYYTNQDNKTMVRVIDDNAQTVGNQIHNFQVSFRDQNGVSTEDMKKIRSVYFSMTGDYVPIQGTINSIVYSNTAVPRNLL